MRVVHYVRNPFQRDVAICGVKKPGHGSEYVVMVTCARCEAILANPLTKRAIKYMKWNPYKEIE